MRRRTWGWIGCGVFLFQGGFALAQSSFEALEQELKEAKQQHQEITAQAMSTFFGQIDSAMNNSEAAVALYQKAGGVLPTSVPVASEHENETATEKEERVGLDQANLSKFGAALQLHCGLMHYAALFAIQPNRKGLQDDWIAWLKSAAQVYPQLSAPPAPSNQKQQQNKGDDQKGGIHRPPPFYPDELKGKAMRDSIISKFLNFKGWADKEQGGWSIRDVPRLYHANVLDPLRASPTAATLAAWDVYIAMANADEPDNDKWYQVDYPPLQFDRACDDYTTAPGTEKLEGLVNLIKANPTYPQVDDWITRVHQLMEDYRTRHGGRPPVAQSPAPAPSSPAGNPNTTVTTVQQGDATIITTHTNSAPVTNTPPAH